MSPLEFIEYAQRNNMSEEEIQRFLRKYPFLSKPYFGPQGNYPGNPYNQNWLKQGVNPDIGINRFPPQIPMNTPIIRPPYNAPRKGQRPLDQQPINTYGIRG